MQPVGGTVGERDQARQEAGQRLAAAGGGDQQDVLAPGRRVQHRKLMLPWRPAAAGEPVLEGSRQERVHTLFT